jgi:Zn-dependent M28 family amino/carboxypeptidase
LISNASWVLPSSSLGTYFEGTNIFAKVEGTDPAYTSGGGVLFSSHYDSVSTAPGVTDVGLGVVTMLQLVEYFAENRPKRTAVFFFNNGEEDGLNGAHLYVPHVLQKSPRDSLSQRRSFLGHPWAKLVDTFFNLEGAAAGG